MKEQNQIIFSKQIVNVHTHTRIHTLDIGDIYIYLQDPVSNILSSVALPKWLKTAQKVIGFSTYKLYITAKFWLRGAYFN